MPEGWKDVVRSGFQFAGNPAISTGAEHAWMEKINIEAATPAGVWITPLPYIGIT